MRCITVGSFAVALAFAFTAAACDKKESGEEYARKQAAEADKERFKDAPKAIKVETPVPGGTLLACNKLLDATALTAAIGEKDLVDIDDQTRSNKDAAAVCSVNRGGKPLSKQEQDKILATKRRLGVTAGDPVCVITAFCWTAEVDAKFKEKCPTTGGTMDSSLGFEACTRVMEVGVDDVKNIRFLDRDSRCVIEVRGGPSNVDNEQIDACARAASTEIGLEQVKAASAPGAFDAPAAPAAP